MSEPKHLRAARGLLARLERDGLVAGGQGTLSEGGMGTVLEIPWDAVEDRNALADAVGHLALGSYGHGIYVMSVPQEHFLRLEIGAEDTLR